MRNLLVGRRKFFWRQIAFICLAWMIVAVFDAYNTRAILEAYQVEKSTTFVFQRYLITSVAAALLGGLLGGSLLVFVLRERFRSRSFGIALLVNSLVLSALIFVINSIVFAIYFSIEAGEQANFQTTVAHLLARLSSTLFLKNLIVWSGVVLLTIIGLHVSEKYGPGVLWKLLLGVYRKPREEERIFMFVDIRSSTTIAESLGHIQFFNLLNDFFRDITNSIIYAEGRVYQYVGDEVIVSWPLSTGLERANCLRCFFNMQRAIKKAAPRYQRKYGLVPEFKAGLHCGMVTVGEIGVIKRDLVFSGDVLNTTSRIQGLCNEYGVSMLASKYLLEKINPAPNAAPANRVGSFQLRGKKQHIELYTLDELPVAWEGRDH